MSIRLRLTLLSSTIMALTLVIFSAALYLTVSRVSLGVIEQTLADETQRLVKSRHFELDRIEYPARKFAAPETYIQTIRLDGDVADRTANLGEVVLPLSESGMSTCRQGRAWIEIMTTDEGRLLVRSQPLMASGEPEGIIQAARSLADYDQALGTLGRTLVLGSGLATLIVFGVGWALAGALLRPIDRITQTAQAIGTERNFGRRVTHTGPHDEIGRLATTFNDMLTALQSAYHQLEQSLQAQRRFVADASHELRTPLTTIRGNLGLLQHEPPISPEDRVAVLNDMVDESERLIRLVNDLLMLARADAGRPLRLEPIPVASLLTDLCRQARLLAPQRTIGCELPPESLLALGDRDALKQVLLILLDNALKYAPPETAIHIGGQGSAEGITLSVQDHGPGIPAALLPTIFERFGRGDSSRTSPGAGLGLAIARALVEAQGGQLHVQSQMGVGSLFTVTLPVATATSPPARSLPG